MNTTDIRSKIHQVVTSISPLDKTEQEHIRFVLDWIESGSEIFRIEKPATPETHLVSYFVITSPDKDQILLVHHKKARLWLNGRTGRIINILYLVKHGLLDTPVLYLSRYINQNKSEYYRLLQAVRDHQDWEKWVLYILEGIE